MITICDPNFWRKLEDKDCVKLIAIVDSEWGIAKSGAISWSFPEDREFFKKVTQKCAVVMGRKTFESLGNIPLKDRINCIVSNSSTTTAKYDINDNIDVCFFGSLEDATHTLKSQSNKNIWIIGGAEIYTYALKKNLVDYAVITKVHKKFDADKFLDQSLLEDPKKFQKGILYNSKEYEIIGFESCRQLKNLHPPS